MREVSAGEGARSSTSPMAGAIISSPKAKIPGFEGASSTLKLDSQRNHLDHSKRWWLRAMRTPFWANESLTNRERFSISQLLGSAFKVLRPSEVCPKQAGGTVAAG